MVGYQGFIKSARPRLLPTPATAGQVAFSPDSTLIAATAADDLLCTWIVAMGAARLTLGMGLADASRVA